MDKRLINFFLLLIFSLTAGSYLFAQHAKLIRRGMTDLEFVKFKNTVGTFKKGKNYNEIYNGHGTGLRPPTEEQWLSFKNDQLLIDKIEFPEGKAGAPANYDNSTTIWFPPIGNQDGEGSCVSWACGYYTKTFQEAKEHNWDLSSCLWEGGYYGYPSAAFQDKIFSPDFIYHQVNDGADNGSYYSDNMNLLQSIGCCTWNRMPYDPLNHTAWPGEQAWRQAPLYRSQTGYGYMWVETNPGLADLKQFIADGNLAVISVHAGLYSTLTSQDLWTVDNYNPSGTNHANTIVGYDDNFGPYTESGNSNTYGAFKVANSWGVGGTWEKSADGFYYISYECMKQRLGYVYIYQNYLNYNPEMVAVFRIDHTLRGENRIDFGFGDPASPVCLKPFDDFNFNGGNAPYPSNPIVIDISDIYLIGTNQFFMQVYDGETSTTGVVEYFSIESYSDYSSGAPTQIYVSSEIPKITQNNSNVYLNVYTLPPEIDITPLSFTFSVPMGSCESQNMIIDNLGNGVLSYSITKSAGSAVPRSLNKEIRISAENRKNPEVNIPAGLNKGQYSYLVKEGLAETSIFFDNMESGMNGWTTSAYTGSDLWHQSTVNYNSGTHSWWCGIEGQDNYDNGTRIDDALITPIINLETYSAPINLEFYENYYTEDLYDNCMVDVSTDGGTRWNQLRGSPGSAPSGNSNGWILSTFDLSPYAGKQILIRFYFDTMDEFAQAYPGWFIDDIHIYSSGINWLVIDPSHGVIPSLSNQNINVTANTAALPPGTYNCDLIVNNNDHDESSVIIPVQLNVLNLNTPIITLQPASQEVIPGQTVSFTVEATCSGSLGFQWWNNLGGQWNNGDKSGRLSVINTSNSSTLTITNTNSLEDNGNQFLCEVKNLNGYPDDGYWINSNIVTLTVLTTSVDFFAGLNVSDSCLNNIELTFGTASDATDGFDLGYDQISPPPPPLGAFDARLRINSEDYLRDFRATNVNGTITWNVVYQPASGCAPVTFTWDPLQLPALGYFTLVDAITGGSLVNVNMRSQSVYTDDLSIGNLQIVFTHTTTFNMNILSGWNMLGLPLEAEDPNYLSLFPDAMPGTLYGFNGAYYSTDELNSSSGYWLRFPAAQLAPVTGTPMPSSCTITLSQGWNMISGLSGTVELDDLSDPEGIIIAGTLYGFDGAYYSAAEIEQGKGYWLRTNTAGSITLNCSSSPLPKTNHVKAEEYMSDFHKVEITDGNGNKGDLYFGGKLSENTNVESFSLPPVAPAGVFDVRFSGGYRLIETDQGTINVQSGSYPIKIKINGGGKLSGKEGYILSGFAGLNESFIKTLNEDQELLIGDSKITALTIKKGEIVPDQYIVFQNYPNPFNPTTTIKFGLPQGSKVQIKVYNMLGELLDQILNEEMEKGYHEVVFDAANYASGIYLFRIEAGEFISVKKMIILK